MQVRSKAKLQPRRNAEGTPERSERVEQIIPRCHYLHNPLFGRKWTGKEPKGSFQWHFFQHMISSLHKNRQTAVASATNSEVALTRYSTKIRLETRELELRRRLLCDHCAPVIQGTQECPVTDSTSSKPDKYFCLIQNLLPSLWSYLMQYIFFSFTAAERASASWSSLLGDIPIFCWLGNPSQGCVLKVISAED